MGDYLGHVTNRVLRRTAVQPRVPSLFEPPPAAAGVRLTPLSGMQIEREAAVEAPAPLLVHSNDGMMHEHRVEKPPAPSVEPRRPPPQKKGEEPLEPARMAGRKPDADVKPASTARATREPASPPRPSDPSDTRVPNRAPRQIVPLRAAPMPAAVPEERASAPSNQVPVRSKIVPGHERVERAAAREIFTALPGSVPARNPSPTLPRPATPAPPIPVAITEAASSISVVIGRVTVQAVMPAPAAPRSASGPPVPRLSLDQYLERRGGRA